MKHLVTAESEALNTALQLLQDGDVIAFAPGDYYLREPIRISGKTGIRLCASGDGPVRLHGGMRIEDWTDEGGGLWSADVPAWSCELYADGIRQQLARWPKEPLEPEKRHYARSTGTATADVRKRTFLFDTAAIPGLQQGAQLTAFLWPSGPQGEYNWHSVFLSCTLHDNRIELAQDTWFDLGRGTRFYLCNHKALLTDEGEFFIDRDALKLYYRPVGGDPAPQCVVLPLMHNLIEIRNCSDVTIEGLTLSETDRPEFNDGEIFDQDTAVIWISERSGNIAIRHCEIALSGLNGICLYRHVRGVTVENCHIHHVGHTGVRAYGDWVSEEFMNRGHLISSNHIHHVGLRVGQAAGVQLLQSGESTIAHNLIHHSSRYAISLLAPNTRTFVKPAFFPDENPVPSYKAKWFTYVRDNVVTRNEVFACNLDSQDTGLIQGFRAGEGIVISDNIVRDSEIHFSFGNGIYLDDCCDGWTLKNNLVYNLNHHGAGDLSNVLTLKGIGNRAENNRFIRNKVGTIGVVSSFSMGDKENYNLRFCRNIIHKNGAALYGNMDWQPARYRKADQNLFSEPGQPLLINGGLGHEGRLSLAQWQRAGYDRNSVAADPGFMDEARDDFRLRYDSPAHALGIEEIDIGAIGLRASYRMEAAAAAREPVCQLSPEWQRDGQTNALAHSWISCRSGEVLQLSWKGRTRSRLLRCNLQPQLSMLTGDAAGLRISDGLVYPLRKGVYRICARLDSAQCLLDIIVDEQMESLRWAFVPETVVQGENCSPAVVARSDYGRDVLLHPHISATKGIDHIGDRIHFTTTGCCCATVHAAGLVAELTTRVLPDRTLDIIPQTAPIATVGIPQPFTVRAILHSGREVAIANPGVEGQHLHIADGSLTIEREGEQKITFCHDAAEAVQYVRALADLPPPEHFTLRQYGPGAGKALQRPDGSLELYSNANNVWYQSDDATFLFREQPAEGMAVDMKIHHIEHTHRFAQNGILVRAADDPQSRCLHFRVDTEGALMVALRREDNAMMQAVLGASPWAKFGAAGNSGIDDRIADGVAFPVNLRLTYRNGTFACFFQKTGQWELLGEVALALPERCLVGAAFFSVDAAHIGCSRFSLQFH
jgi:hypothetical protein